MRKNFDNRYYILPILLILASIFGVTNALISLDRKIEIERLDGVVAQKQLENDDLRNTTDDLEAENLILSDANAVMGVENQRLVTENEKLKAAAIEVAPIDVNALLEQANQILETTNP